MGKIIYELSPEEKNLIDLIRTIRFGTVNEVIVQDGRIRLAKIKFPAEIYGIECIETVKLDLPLDKINF